MHVDHPVVMGILNVTPDSFSDGGKYSDVVAAILYLADATRVTGQVITIDAGHHFRQLARDVQFLESR